jgi:hypothetical protein
MDKWKEKQEADFGFIQKQEMFVNLHQCPLSPQNQ